MGIEGTGGQRRIVAAAAWTGPQLLDRAHLSLRTLAALLGFTQGALNP